MWTVGEPDVRVGPKVFVQIARTGLWSAGGVSHGRIEVRCPDFPAEFAAQVL